MDHQPPSQCRRALKVSRDQLERTVETALMALQDCEDQRARWDRLVQLVQQDDL